MNGVPSEGSLIERAKRLFRADNAGDPEFAEWNAAADRWLADAESLDTAPQFPSTDDYRAALEEMGQAYSETFFSPLSVEQLKKLVKAMGHNTDIAAPSDRLHASWGRHLVATIERKAEQYRAERTETTND